MATIDTRRRNLALGAPETRVACVCVPDFLLQSSTRELPKDFHHPVALVDREDARATIIAVDSNASRRKIYPGLRYVSAVAICPELHAVSSHPRQIDQIHQRVLHDLGSFSPGVESAQQLPGTYYLDCSGMDRLEPDFHAWAKRIRETLWSHERLKACIAIGFTRFGTFAAARSSESVVIFKSILEEREAAFSTPLAHMNLPARPMKELEKLAVHTVGDLRRLPEWEVRSRFAEELFDLVRRTKDENGSVHGIRLPEPYLAHIDLEYVESDAERILTVIQRIWTPLLKRMKEHAQGVRELHIRLEKNVGETCYEKLQTAKPTLDEPAIVELLRLRLHALNLDHGITALGIRMIPGELPDPQLDLHRDFVKPAQDAAAAERALARVCAEFGPQRVLRAKCLRSHLPEESFAWEFFDRMREPAPARCEKPGLIRRIFDQPVRISTPRRTALQRVLGPYSISGFWWREATVHRSSYFVEAMNGTVQWVFYDRIARQWYEQGFVE